MDHIAIMKKSWGLIPKILSGDKTIESRWYKARIAPWDRIKVGDRVYFKNSGESVTVVTEVDRVLQFDNLDLKVFENIMVNYADQICLINRDYNGYYQNKKYCILVFLGNVKKLDKPFDIDKTGYGCSCAWMTMDSVEEVVKTSE